MGGRGGSSGGRGSLSGSIKNYGKEYSPTGKNQPTTSAYHLANHGGQIGFTEDQWKGSVDKTYKALGYNTSSGGMLYMYGSNGSVGGKNFAAYNRLAKDGKTYVYEISNPHVIKQISNTVIPATANHRMSEAIRNTLGFKLHHNSKGKEYVGL